MDNDRIQQAGNRILEHPAVKGLRAALSKSSSPPPVHLVGGAVRDAWLGREIRDFDFVIAGDARAAALELAGMLDARYVLLDEDWGVARLVWSPTGDREEIIWLDFASMRGASIEEDLWQRDFTCNAMAMPITPDDGAEGSAWHDPAEGLKDLAAGRIRMVHPARFREDPLRLIRAFRLACELEFQVEDRTMETIREERSRISTVAAERIRDELFKIFACPHSLPWVLRMDETGLLATLFPELQGLKGLEQGRSHHLDAWNHTFEAYRILEQICCEGFERLAPWEGELKEWIHREENPCALLKMAVLFHDAGKSATFTVDSDGEPHFYGHAGLGEKIVSAAMRRLRASHRDEERVRKWVRYHMGPAHMRKAMEKDHLTERAKIRLLRRLGRDAPGILVLSLADFLATAIPSTTSDKERSFHELVDSLLELYFKRDAASVNSKHLATGKDLIDALGIPPGPMVGRLLRLLEEARVEGRITNRSEALLLARSLLDESS